MKVDAGWTSTVDHLLESVDKGFVAVASGETLARTTLGSARVGQPVHLERALAMGDRLGGHIVSGHVDAVGRVLDRARLICADGDALVLALRGACDFSKARDGSIGRAGACRVLARGDLVVVAEFFAHVARGGPAPTLELAVFPHASVVFARIDRLIGVSRG